MMQKALRPLLRLQSLSWHKDTMNEGDAAASLFVARGNL